MPAAGPPRFKRPPVIVVDVDTLRADHLGCYGYSRDTSPNIDLFSRDAVRFTWAYSQAPNTPPSQSSIFTSLYPTTHGRVANDQVLSSDIVTLAEVLNTVGYRTAAFVDGGLVARGFGLEQGFDVYDDSAGGLRKIGPRAVSWIRDRLAERPRWRKNQRTDDSLEPFFLLIHTYDVHSPYENEPEPFRSMFLDDVEMPSEYYRNNMSKVMAEVWNSRFKADAPKLTPQELDYAVAMYDSGIRHVDWWFGEFVRFLKDAGIYDPSILIFISDHGDEFEEHGGLFHEKLYSEITHIPFMIKLPHGEESGVFTEDVESIDMMPTLLEALELPGPPAMEGESLLGLLKEPGPRRSYAVSESPFFGRRIAVTRKKYRLLYTLATGQSELYLYRTDRKEQRDVSEEYPSVVRRLRREAMRWRKMARANRYEPGNVRDLKDETLTQLRALGYIK